MKERTFMMLPQKKTKKKKTKKLKLLRKFRKTETLPSLYFSLASALSLASKYQTVMAYLPDKEDEKCQIPD